MPLDRIFLITSLILISIHSEASFAATLRSSFRLDETSGNTISDSVSGTTGTVSGTGVTFTTGKVGGGLSLEGSTSLPVVISDSPSFAFLNSQSFTVSIWVKDSPSVGSWSSAFAKGNTRTGYCSGATAGIVLGHFSNVQNRFIFAVKDDAGHCAFLETATPVAYSNPTAPGYHLLTLVVNRANATLSAYVNFVSIGQTSISTLGTLNLTGLPIVLGAGISSTNASWKGVLDDVKIYEGALSLSEIRAAFFSGNVVAGNLPPTVNLISPVSNGGSLSYQRDQQIKISAEAQDSDGGVVLVQYMANGVVVGESVTPPYAFTWERMPANAYSVVARAFDVTAAYTDSTPLAITVNNLNFSDTINPTGSPIGGGKGYASIPTEATAQYVVTDSASFLSALSTASTGQTIYVKDTATIDLTGHSSLVIPAGVTIASGRGRGSSKGGLILSNDRFPENNYIPLFKTGGTGIRITGLRLKGPNPEVLDQGYAATGVANLLMTLHDGLTVDNCEVYAWDKWAFYLQRGGNHWIHHNFFHDTLRSGYGYSVWVGGSNPPTGTTWSTLIEANLFQRCRHCIASSGHLNSWESRYNVFLDQNLFVNVDRHDQGTTGIGGDNTSLHHNLFFDTLNVNWGITSPATPTGLLQTFHNWLTRSSFGAENIPTEPYTGGNPQVSSYDNRLNFDTSAFLPQLKVLPTVTEGTAPLSVKFSTTGSSDPSGYGISQYRWMFGDGDTYGRYSESASPTINYSNPGRYLVRLMARNSKGVPNILDTPILVKPTGTGKWLTLWLLDSYIGPLKNYFKKEVVVNGTVVWSDDVAGNEGWKYIKVDVTNLLAGATTADIRVRLKTINAMTNPTDGLNGITEMRLWVDDVYLFGGTVKNGDFESSTIEGWTINYAGVWGCQIRSESARSGRQSLVLRKGLWLTTTPGESVEAQQVVPLTP